MLPAIANNVKSVFFDEELTRCVHLNKKMLTSVDHSECEMQNL